eukprot:2295015-Rhodomonas_salina.1
MAAEDAGEQSKEVQEEEEVGKLPVEELNMKLWKAAEEGNAELIRELVEEGAEVNSQPELQDEDDDEDEEAADGESKPSAEADTSAAGDKPVKEASAASEKKTEKASTEKESGKVRRVCVLACATTARFLSVLQLSARVWRAIPSPIWQMQAQRGAQDSGSHARCCLPLAAASETGVSRRRRRRRRRRQSSWRRSGRRRRRRPRGRGRRPTLRTRGPRLCISPQATASQVCCRAPPGVLEDGRAVQDRTCRTLFLAAVFNVPTATQQPRAEQGHAACALVDLGGDVNILNDELATPLHFAVAKSHTDTVQVCAASRSFAMSSFISDIASAPAWSTRCHIASAPAWSTGCHIQQSARALHGFDAQSACTARRRQTAQSSLRCQQHCCDAARGERDTGARPTTRLGSVDWDV